LDERQIETRKGRLPAVNGRFSRWTDDPQRDCSFLCAGHSSCHLHSLAIHILQHHR